jgi:hypothetical protein
MTTDLPFRATGIYSVIIHHRRLSFMSAAILESCLTVSPGIYVSYDQGKVPVASLATETEILVSLYNVPDYFYTGDLPSISIDDKFAYVMFSNFDYERSVLTLAFLAPIHPSRREGKAVGWIWFEQNSPNVGVAFSVDYVDDTVPNTEPVFQQLCTNSNCVGPGGLVAFQIGGIFSNFSTPDPGKYPITRLILCVCKKVDLYILFCLIQEIDSGRQRQSVSISTLRLQTTIKI